MAVQAKADMNAVYEAHKTGDESVLSRKDKRAEEIIRNLDKYEKILKE